MLITGKGHANITARHRTTIAFTRDKEITKNGDCFVACCAGYKVSKAFLKKLRESKKATITISCGGVSDKVTAKGHPQLTLSDKTDLVIRKSDYVCGRTLAIHADKAAISLKRDLIKQLQLGKPVKVKISP